jgi:DNA-binding response OmpR family regulator
MDSGSRLRRVLVVEDHALVAETITSALEDSYDVLHVSEAESALEVLTSSVVDLVLLDCLLPGGRYAEVIMRCDQAGTPVVLMSGDLERGEVLKTEHRPFLAKPFSIEALLRTVEQLLRGYSQANRN